MKEPLLLACASDRAYVPHTAAMLHSVLAWRGDREVVIYYLHGADLPRDAPAKLTGMVESLGGRIEFLEIPAERVADVPSHHQGLDTPSMWYRVQLPELLPDAERILYLDGDAIVVDSLEELWTIDMGDNYVAAVTNVFEPHYAWLPERLGMSDPLEYFNSGVLLMNLELMRRDNRTPALWEWAHAHADKLLWNDQDALSAVLGSRRLALAPRWNCMTAVLVMPEAVEVFGAEAVEEARRNPAIRHFEGPPMNKPWHLLCSYDMADVYFEHRRGTPWPRVRREGVTLRNVVTRTRRALGV